MLVAMPHYIRTEWGRKSLAVSDVNACLIDDNGIDIENLFEYAKTHNGVSGFNGCAKEVDREEIFSHDCDVFMPCALENAITVDNAEKIRAKIICEGANGPITPAAEKMLMDKGIFIVPDILANSGGVTVSYFEWVQNLHNFYWTFGEVQEKQEVKMEDAFNKIIEIAER